MSFVCPTLGRPDDFDSTDTGNATTSSPVSPSATSPGAQGRALGQNAAAIAGGTVGGVTALVFLTASLLCYRRYKRRGGSQFPSAEGEAALGPHGSLREVAPIAFDGTSTIHQMESPVSEVRVLSIHFSY